MSKITTKILEAARSHPAVDLALRGFDLVMTLVLLVTGAELAANPELLAQGSGLMSIVPEILVIILGVLLMINAANHLKKALLPKSWRRGA